MAAYRMLLARAGDKDPGNLSGRTADTAARTSILPVIGIAAPTWSDRHASPVCEAPAKWVYHLHRVCFRSNVTTPLSAAAERRRGTRHAGRPQFHSALQVVSDGMMLKTA